MISWTELKADPEALTSAIKTGMDRARRQGKRIGRPPAVHKEPEVEELLLAGWAADRVRRELHVGTGMVRRVLARIKSGRA